jgi:hypothetical protein
MTHSKESAGTDKKVPQNRISHWSVTKQLTPSSDLPVVASPIARSAATFSQLEVVDQPGKIDIPFAIEYNFHIVLANRPELPNIESFVVGSALETKNSKY